MREIVSEIEIKAPASMVWAVLTDIAAYPSWNPFIRSIAGTLRAGGRPKVRLRPPGSRSRTFRPRIVRMTEDREIVWRGRMLSPLLRSEHAFVIERIDDVYIRLVQRHRLATVTAVLLAKTLHRAQAGFEAMDWAVKARAEALVQTS